MNIKYYICARLCKISKNDAKKWRRIHKERTIQSQWCENKGSSTDKTQIIIDEMNETKKPSRIASDGMIIVWKMLEG